MGERRAQVPGVDILFGGGASVEAGRPGDAPLPAPGPDPVPALLAVLVAAVDATHVVELEPPGSHTTTALVASLAGAAVVTTIGRTLPEGLRDQLRDAGARDRARLVASDPVEVLPRLTDGGYDLVVAYDDALAMEGLREQAARLLRPGGMLVAVADGATAPLEDLVHELVDDPRFRAAFLPVRGGLALAVRDHGRATVGT